MSHTDQTSDNYDESYPHHLDERSPHHAAALGRYSVLQAPPATGMSEALSVLHMDAAMQAQYGRVYGEAVSVGRFRVPRKMTFDGNRGSGCIETSGQNSLVVNQTAHLSSMLMRAMDDADARHAEQMLELRALAKRIELIEQALFYAPDGEAAALAKASFEGAVAAQTVPVAAAAPSTEKRKLDGDDDVGARPKRAAHEQEPQVQ